MNVEVAVLGRNLAVCVNGKAFGEGTRAEQVGIAVLVEEPKPVALTVDFGVFGVVAVETECDECGKAVLVCPVEIVFVQVEVCPVVTGGHLQGVDALENTVTGACDDRLHRNSVMADAEAVSVVGANVFVAYGVFAGIVCVSVRKSEVERSAVVFPRHEEFFFLPGVESVSVDVVNAVADFEQESDLDCVLFERVRKDSGKACLCLELTFAKHGKVGRIFAKDYHRNEQRNIGDWLVVALDAGEFDVCNFKRLFDTGRECTAECDLCIGGLLRDGARGVCNFQNGVAEDDLRNAGRRVCGLLRFFGARNDVCIFCRFNAACVGDLNDAVALGYGNGGVVYHRRCAIGHFIKRETVFVVFGKVECVACEGRSEGAADYVGERAFASAGERFFN